MAKDPAARYESARSLHADLLGLKQELEGSGSRVAPGLDGFVNHEREPAVVRFKTLVAAGVVAALLAAWFGSGLLQRGHVPKPEAVVWYDRGTSAIREGAYFQAGKALDRALEIDSAFALARARRSEAYAEVELTDKAREELLQAMALLPDRSSLSNAESLYVDAVAATLNRDFKTAIEKYSQIVSSAGDRTSLRPMSISAAPTRKTRISIEPLNRTCRRRSSISSLPPAFLRSGILYGRRLNLPKANDAFLKAQEIYQAMSSQEGLAEVYYQRGSLRARIRRLPEAREQLERSLEMSRSASNDTNRSGPNCSSAACTSLKATAVAPRRWLPTPSEPRSRSTCGRWRPTA